MIHLLKSPLPSNSVKLIPRYIVVLTLECRTYWFIHAVYLSTVLCVRIATIQMKLLIIVWLFCMVQCLKPAYQLTLIKNDVVVNEVSEEFCEVIDKQRGTDPHSLVGLKVPYKFFVTIAHKWGVVDVGNVKDWDEGDTRQGEETEGGEEMSVADHLTWQSNGVWEPIIRGLSSFKSVIIDTYRSLVVSPVNYGIATYVKSSKDVIWEVLVTAPVSEISQPIEKSIRECIEDIIDPDQIGSCCTIDELETKIIVVVAGKRLTQWNFFCADFKN